MGVQKLVFGFKYSLLALGILVCFFALGYLLGLGPKILVSAAPSPEVIDAQSHTDPQPIKGYLDQSPSDPTAVLGDSFSAPTNYGLGK